MTATHFFLVIGAQKAGTSWLHAQLGLHPEVHVPRWKELHYFTIACPPPEGSYAAVFVHRARQALAEQSYDLADSILERLGLPLADRDGTAYREYLLREAGPGVRAVGEVTPAYATLTEDGFRLAYDTLDAPRVIFLMRDPLERYWCSLRMRDPDRAAELFGRRVRADRWARSDYQRTITRLEAVFPPHLVHYAFYEELFTPDALRGIARFLGVADEWPWEIGARRRMSRVIAMPEPTPELVARFRPVYEFVRARFGDRVPATWRY